MYTYQLLFGVIQILTIYATLRCATSLHWQTIYAPMLYAMLLATLLSVVCYSHTPNVDQHQQGQTDRVKEIFLFISFTCISIPFSTLSPSLYIRTSPPLAPFMVCADTVCSCNLVSSLGDIGNMLPYKHAN